MIKLEKINKTYPNGVHALHNISLEFDNPGLIFMLGKSGAGKSTLLNIIGGLDDFTGGVYSLFGKNVSNITRKEWDEIRNFNFGFVFQEYMLLDDMNVYDNISFALKLQNDKIDKFVIDNIMSKVGISDLCARKVNELSGGQKQRVAIARALVKAPKVILADEPTGNLDDSTSQTIYELLEKLSEEYLIIVVSHDSDAAYKYADRIIQLKDGSVLSDEQNTKSVYDIFAKEKTITNVTENQISKYITTLTSDCISDFKIKKHPIVKSEKKSKLLNDKSVLNNASLSIKNSFLFSIRGMKNHYARFILNSIVYILTFFLLIMAAYISLFDMNKAIYSYIDTYSIKEYIFYKDIQYNTIFGDLKTTTVRTGFAIYNELSDIFEPENIYGRKQNSLSSKDSLLNYNANIVYCDDSYSSKFGSVSFANDKNLIYPTDYVIDKLNLDYNTVIGTTYYIDNIEYVVGGVIATDYNEYNVDEKMSLTNDEARYARYHLNNEYNVIYANRETLKQKAISSSRLNIQASNLFAIQNINIYSTSKLTFGKAGLLDKNTLIAGRMPKNDNEIVVSTECLDMAGYIESEYDEVFSSQYSFLDLYDTQYNGYYQELLNLYDYMPTDINIVGIYDEMKIADPIGAYVCMPDKIFDRVISDYYTKFYYDDFLVVNRSVGDKFIYEIGNVGLNFDDPSVNILYSFDEIINLIVPYMYVVLGILLVLTVFLIFTYLNAQMNSNKKTIGILKALGVHDKDILKIYLFQILFLAVISLLFTMVFHLVTLAVLNFNMMLTMIEKPFQILYTNVICCIIVSAFIILTFALSSLYPLIKTAKEKPMKTIRGI